jgi:hypothetical protein
MLIPIESGIVKLVEDAVPGVFVLGVGVEVDDIGDSFWIFYLLFS